MFSLVKILAILIKTFIPMMVMTLTLGAVKLEMARLIYLLLAVNLKQRAP